jgi:lipoprotein LprG
VRVWVFYLLLPSLLIACRPPPSLPELPAGEIVQRSSDRMMALDGFRFVIDRSGEPTYLDLAQTIAFRRAEGYFVAPDKTRATVRIIAPGLVADVHVIAIGLNQWETNVLTGQWQELPPDWGFNPAILFDHENGLPAILANDLWHVAQQPPAQLKDGPNKLLYNVAGQVDGRRLHIMSAGLLGPDMMDIALWIDPDDFNLHRALVTTSGNENEITIWQLDFTDFGRVVDIQPPPQQ